MERRQLAGHLLSGQKPESEPEAEPKSYLAITAFALKIECKIFICRNMRSSSLIKAQELLRALSLLRERAGWSIESCRILYMPWPFMLLSLYLPIQFRRVAHREQLDHKIRIVLELFCVYI